MKALALLLVASVAYADPSPVVGAGPPPPHANKLPSGTAWVTLARGSGARARSSDWVVFYGGTDHESREVYYMPRVLQAASVMSVDMTGMAVGETRRYWTPNTAKASASTFDIQLVAILPAKPATAIMFPSPNDVRVAANHDRYVTIEAGKSRGVHAEAGDLVDFYAYALDEAAQTIDLGLPFGALALADIGVPAIVDALHDMNPGEVRYVWTRHQGKPMFVEVKLYSFQQRLQVSAPPDVAAPPTTAKIGPGVHYMVLAAGSGDRFSGVDDVTLDYTVWSPTGRTIAIATNATQRVDGNELHGQLLEMRVGERRRIWMEVPIAGRWSEANRGAVVEVTVRSVHRNMDILPGGMRIEYVSPEVAVVRGASRAVLPMPIVALAGAKLANGVVTFTGNDSSDHPATATMRLTELEARLYQVDAAQALASRQVDVAIATSKRALANAPEIPELYIDLAHAYVVGNNLREAAKSLAPLIARNPVWVYWQVHARPEMAALVGEKEIAALRVKAPKPVDLSQHPVLTTHSGRYLAVQMTEQNWGTDNVETPIEIIDTATHASVARIVSDASVETWLSELGFAEPAGLEVGVVEESRVAFAKAKITVTASGEVRRGTKRLGRAPGVDEYTHAAYWLPSMNAIVYEASRPGHECCEASDPVWVVVSKL